MSSEYTSAEKVLENVALAAIREQRAARRWRITFRLAWLAMIMLFLAWTTGWLPSGGQHDKKTLASTYTATIGITGEITSEGKNNVIADQIITALRDAFENKHVQGVILKANSPGGSPVAAARIYDEIRALRQLYPNKPIYTVVDDLCASACYFIASATDQIFVNRASLIGSIGVLMDSFGFTGTMQKLGIERRLLTAGNNKGLLDPFSPMTVEQKAFIQTLLADVHQQFITAVKTGRGERLKESPDMFSGLMWTGTKAIKMGLVDGEGTVDYVAKELIKAGNIVDFTPKRALLDLLTEQVDAMVNKQVKALLTAKLQS